MMTERKKMSSNEIWKKDADVLQATDAVLDLCIDGYGDIWALVRFVFYAQYLSYGQWGLTPESAIPAFLRKKENFPTFWKALFMNLCNNVMTGAAESPHPMFAEVLTQLKDCNHVVRRHILPAINDAGITSAMCWQSASLLFRVNERRCKCAIRDRKPRLSWMDVQFLHEYHDHLANQDVQPSAMVGLRAIESRALLTKEQKENHLPLTNDGKIVICNTCGGAGHYANQCSNRQPKLPKKKVKKLRFKQQQPPKAKPDPKPMILPMMFYNTGGSNEMINPQEAALAAVKHLRQQQQQQLEPPKAKRPRIEQQQQQQQQPKAKPDLSTGRDPRGSMKGVGMKFYTPTGALKQQYRGAPACHFFAGRYGGAKCRFGASDCRFPHYCEECGATNHGQSNCPNAREQRM